MKLDLPPVKPFRMVSQQTNGWSDNYAAMHIAAAYAGVKLDAPYFIRGIWHHGCFGPWEAYSVDMLACNTPRAKGLPVLTARQEEADLLRANGYSRARAIGLPILYTPPSGAARIPRSLLVMPCHTLVGNTFADRAPFLAYAREIKALAPRFDRVVVCIHPNCRKNGLWVKEFTDAGLELVDGAQVNDLNALPRMRALFEQFETVTTNGWGSHIAYALAFGARVAVYGTYPAPGEENLLQDVTWASDKAALKQALSAETAAKEKAFLRDFLVPPTQAVANRELGDWLVGAKLKLPPAEMAAQLAGVLDVARPGWSTERRLLFVLPDAARTDAAVSLLQFLGWLRAEGGLNFELLIEKSGPLEGEFERLSLVHKRPYFEAGPAALKSFDLIFALGCSAAGLVETIGGRALPVVTWAQESDLALDALGARRLAECIRQTDQFVAAGPMVAARLHRRFGLPQAEIAVHGPMISQPDTGVNAGARARFDLPKDAFVVVAGGAVSLENGADLFVQVARSLRSMFSPSQVLRCVWAGPASDPRLLRALEQDVRRLGLQGVVRFVVEPADTGALAAAGDLYCLPARDGRCTPGLLEAAALGRPVVGFAGAGDAEEFCSQGGGVIVPYLSAEAMASACADLLREPLRRETLGRQAAELVRAEFNAASAAPRLRDELRRILDLPRRVRRPAQSTLTEIYERWDLADTAQRAAVTAQLERARLRRQAAGLMATGRNREAAALLVKAVNADFATKDPEIICESLLEIASDLAPLDAKQAAVLAERAAQVAQNAQLNLELYRPWGKNSPEPAHHQPLRRSA